ncbi:MAG: O-antigen ligase family protein [Bryobacteraceae bacterium]|nr:O-antigen ligase family protein [Bryobacteraceae bacterium]
MRRAVIVALALLAPVLHVVGAGGAKVNLGLADPLVLAVVPWIVWRFLARQARLPLFMFALAMAAGTLLSTLLHYEISFYVRSPLGLAAGIGKALFVWAYFYAAVNLLESREDMLLLTKSWIAGSAAVAAIGIAGSAAHQWAGVENRFTLAYRAQGTMGDPNLFSTHLGVSLFLTLFFCEASGRRPRWVFPAMALQIAGMIMSASRSGLLGFAAGVGLLLIFRASAGWRLATVCAAAAAVASVAFVPDARKLVEANQITGRLATTTVDVRATDRAKLWEGAWNNFLNAPLLGVGYENGPYVNRSVAGTSSEAHNTYLSIASELGIGGLAVFLTTVLYFPAMLWKGVRDGGPRRQAAWPLLAAFADIGVVAMAYNADNYRGLWVLMAVAYWFRTTCWEERTDDWEPADERAAQGAAAVSGAAC